MTKTPRSSFPLLGAFFCVLLGQQLIHCVQIHVRMDVVDGVVAGVRLDEGAVFADVFERYPSWRYADL